MRVHQSWFTRAPTSSSLAPRSVSGLYVSPTSVPSRTAATSTSFTSTHFRSHGGRRSSSRQVRACRRRCPAWRTARSHRQRSHRHRSKWPCAADSRSTRRWRPCGRGLAPGSTPSVRKLTPVWPIYRMRQKSRSTLKRYSVSDFLNIPKTCLEAKLI